MLIRNYVVFPIDTVGTTGMFLPFLNFSHLSISADEVFGYSTNPSVQRSYASTIYLARN